MIRSNGGKRISQFLINNTPLSEAKFTYVEEGVNYAITFEELLPLLGATGALEQTGADTAIPILDVDGSVNYIRGVENGPGVQAEISSENGLVLKMNYDVNTTGAAVMINLLDDQPTIRSIVSGGGCTVSASGDTIVITVP